MCVHARTHTHMVKQSYDTDEKIQHIKLIKWEELLKTAGLKTISFFNSVMKLTWPLL